MKWKSTTVLGRVSAAQISTQSWISLCTAWLIDSYWQSQSGASHDLYLSCLEGHAQLLTIIYRLGVSGWAHAYSLAISSKPTGIGEIGYLDTGKWWCINICQACISAHAKGQFPLTFDRMILVCLSCSCIIAHTPTSAVGNAAHKHNVI